MRLSSFIRAAIFAAAAGPTLAGARVPRPPAAEKRPYEVVSPHGTRVDPYYWLRDDSRSKPEVLAYLKAENAYFEAATAHSRGSSRPSTRSSSRA